MNNNQTGADNSPLVVVPFFSVRNISSPEDTQSGRSIYAGQVPITAVLDLPTNDNVRDYLVQAEGKKRKASTQVHRAIRETLDDHPEMFSVLNGGIVIVARDSEINEKKKELRLLKPSIINGSQTQGVLRDYLGNVDVESDIHVKFELIITDDDDLIAEVSIARNFQNDVHSLSIAGRRGQLDELEKSIQSALPEKRLQKSETQLPTEGTDYLPTEKLLQIIAALMPAELWWKPGEANKTYTYSRKAACLKDFQELYKASKDSEHTHHSAYSAAYQFYIDVAPSALNIYRKWKTHQGFTGCGLHSIIRDGRKIQEVPDGLIFPILAALSEFAIKRGGQWAISPPAELDDSELIEAAVSAHKEIAKHKPEIMGKTKACYTQVQQIAKIYRKMANVSS